ncbi:MAG: ATPase [Gammaproteobacteria bacterium]|nr:ATPase [Gammaproteobacteria bacterium]
MDQVKELENAILARADRLAGEYRERAERSRDTILRDASEKLHLREEREVLMAKAKADRIYRRMVQANELKLQKEMDLLRWNLVEEIQERLVDRMKQLIADRDKYLEFLVKLLENSAQTIECPSLVAQVNARDREWLAPVWDTLTGTNTSQKPIALSHETLDTVGGVLVHSEDNRIRLDNTFEGRLHRLRARLHQVIVERLLPDGRDRSLKT